VVVLEEFKSQENIFVKYDNNKKKTINK